MECCFFEVSQERRVTASLPLEIIMTFSENREERVSKTVNDFFFFFTSAIF